MWYAGGTELLLAMKMGLARPSHLIDIKRIDDLGVDLEVRGSVLEVGARVTHQRIASDTQVRRAWPAFANLSNDIGNIRVRSSGTLCGNLAFAEPRSDPATFLLAAKASVVIASKQGERDCLLSDLIVGPYQTSLADDELVVRVRIPKRLVTGYIKSQVSERPTLGLALSADTDEGLLLQPVLAVGAATDQPIIAERASRALDGAPLEPTHPKVVEAAETAAAEVETFGDLTGSAEYKSHLISVLVPRLIEHASRQFLQ